VSKSKILILEDDRYISNFLSVSLEKEGYGVLTAESAAEGLYLLSSQHPDILLLDLGLPDLDGLDVISQVRELTALPILVVTARGQEQEKIEALDRGANDYITKPFHLGELLARIRVAERMMQLAHLSETETDYTSGALRVDFIRRRVTVEGREIHLTPIEYRLLTLLIHHRGKVLTHHTILREIWGYESGDTKSVRVFMASLRRKIEQDTASPRYILTEVGVGYRFADE